MNKLIEGRNTALVLVSSWTLQVGDGVWLKTAVPFPLSVNLDWYPYVKGDEEEPPQPEYTELLSATLLSPLYLTNSRGVTCSIDSRACVLELLRDDQYDMLVHAVTSHNYCYGFDGKAVTL